MNIFVLDRNPQRAARYHCDRHVVKMVLETAQLLSTQLWAANPAAAQQLLKRGTIYRPTHRRHPCALWAGASLGNYLWLCRLGGALADEYAYRYQGKAHSSATVINNCRRLAEQHPERVVAAAAVTRKLTPFAQAMPEEYKSNDPVHSYRLFYAFEKAHFCTWTRRHTPKWFSELALKATALRGSASLNRPG